jgi:hypothetical protein
MSDDFNDVIERINTQYDGLAADNSQRGFRWSLGLSWDEISIENPLVQKAINSSRFKEYFKKWYSNWNDKSIDGKVECFEAALISFIGCLFKHLIGKLSNGEIEVIDFTCEEDDEGEKFDYIKCKFDEE